MIIKLTPLLAVLVLASACSSPPKAPVVDDSKKRPVNAGAAVDLQMCRSELAAAEIVLTETLNVQQREAAVAQLPPTAQSGKSSASPQSNQIGRAHV